MIEPTRRALPKILAGAICALLIAAAVVLAGPNLRLFAALVEGPPADFAVTVAPGALLPPMRPEPALAGAATPALVLPALTVASAEAELYPPSALIWADVSPAQGPSGTQRDPAFDRPRAQPATPSRLVIPAIRLDVPIAPATWVALPDLNAGYFDAPALRAAGWQPTSARLGDPGNLVLSGHNNIQGRVFENLKDLRAGDPVYVFAGQREIAYRVTERRLLLEKDQPLEVRTSNAQYIQPGGDDRLTLVTCWPPDNNTHRIIVIARPVSEVVDGKQ